MIQIGNSKNDQPVAKPGQIFLVYNWCTQPGDSLPIWLEKGHPSIIIIGYLLWPGNQGGACVVSSDRDSGRYNRRKDSIWEIVKGYKIDLPRLLMWQHNFKAKERVTDYQQKLQEKTYYGANIQHQNSTNERCINILQNTNRNNHAHVNWLLPDSIPARMWPYQMRNTQTVLNEASSLKPPVSS